MTGPRVRGVLLAAAAAAAAVLVSSALSAPAGRRPPPSVGVFCGSEFAGRFVGSRPGELSSFIHLCPGNSDTLVAVWGSVPATCRETPDLGGALVGPEKGISVEFNTMPFAPIRADGSFAFTARSPKHGLGFTKATVHARGTFDGKTVEGRITFTTGATDGRYTRCSADGRFKARLTA